MSEKQKKLTEKEFLASLGLDDILLTTEVQQEPRDDRWLLETMDTLTLLRQLGAMVNNNAPVLEPPPKDSSGGYMILLIYKCLFFENQKK